MCWKTSMLFSFLFSSPKLAITLPHPNGITLSNEWGAAYHLYVNYCPNLLLPFLCPFLRTHKDKQWAPSLPSVLTVISHHRAGASVPYTLCLHSTVTINQCLSNHWSHCVRKTTNSLKKPSAYWNVSFFSIHVPLPPHSAQAWTCGSVLIHQHETLFSPVWWSTPPPPPFLFNSYFMLLGWMCINEFLNHKLWLGSGCSLQRMCVPFGSVYSLGGL